MIDMALLERLCRTNGVSGDEGRVREIILSEIKDCADSVTVDGMGNVLAFKKGRNPAKTKLLLSAHMDEVGFIVTDITRDGMLSVEPVGGIDRRVVCGKPVTVGRARSRVCSASSPSTCSSRMKRTKCRRWIKFISISARK